MTQTRRPSHGGTRRTFLRGAAMLTAASPLAPLAALAHDSKPHVPRIYMILAYGETPAEQGFRDYFAQHKLKVEFIERNVDLDISRVPALIAEARALGADLIYTWGTSVTLAVAGKEGAVDPDAHETDIPVVFTMVSTPQAAGVVRSLQSSHRNITGTCHVVPVSQQMKAIRAWRRFARIATIYNPNELNSQATVRELRAEAAQCGCEIIAKPVPLDANGQPQVDALPGMVNDLARQGVQLLYIGPDNFLATHRKLLTQVALDAHLPTFAATEINLRDGKALFGLVSGNREIGKLTAHKTAQILFHGRSPSEIPIETIGSFNVLVNMDVAARLGMPPPKQLLQHAELIR
ncbi:ABC transporter substrate-binding protein [Pseudoduganella sp. RAF53_2]|uniref:ABC transporter substrate-binding protein n=1 Tax=unclassified Pseudoduganella TaxID=2637179 RepID=UPI003F9464F7